MELRAAHAKLRESHRRVLRERDSSDRERSEVVGRHHQLLRAAERQEGRLTQITQQVGYMHYHFTQGRLPIEPTREGEG